MYGSPSATFIIEGTINDDTEQTIQGIKVILKQEYGDPSDLNIWRADSIFSDESGNYEVSMSDFPMGQEFIVDFEDVDGETNGSYEDQTIRVVFEDPEFTGGDGSWYEGEVTKEQDITLDEKDVD